MQSITEQKLFEMINKIFKDIALSLGEIIRANPSDEKLITLLANKLEDHYYEAIDDLEAATGARVVFDTEP